MTHAASHRPRRMPAFILRRGSAALLTLLPCATQAALPDESTLYSEVPRLATATRMEQSAPEIPASVTVLDRAMIEASGALEIVDLLRFVPGFQTAWFSGSSHAAAYHGQSARFEGRFQILVNGRAPASANLGSVDWVNLGVDITDIERIEVVRSPSSPSYGLDAMLGVINIVTREPYAVQGSLIQAVVGTQATRKLLARHGTQLGPVDLSVTLGARQDEGLGEVHLTGDNTDIVRFGDQVHDDKELYHLALHGEYSPDSRRTLEFELGYDDSNLQSDNFELPFNPPAVADVSADHQLIRYTQALAEQGDLRVQFYRDRYLRDEHQTLLFSDALSRFLDMEVPPEAIPLFFDGQPDQLMDFSEVDASTTRYDLELQHRFAPAAGWRVVWGAGYRDDRVEAERLLANGGDAASSAPRLFGNLEKALGTSAIANLGTHYEADSPAGDLLSWRLGLNWLATPEHALRVALSQGERSASLLEDQLYSPLRFQDGTVLNVLRLTPEQLAPECLRVYELGYVGLWPARRLGLDVKVFREELRNGITTATDEDFDQPGFIDDNDVFVLTNGTEVDTNGVEAGLRYRSGPRDFVALNAGYAHAKGQRIRKLNPEIPTSLADETPELSLGILASKTLPHGWELSGALTRVSDMTWQGDGDFIDGHNQVDLRVAKRFRFKGSALTVEAIGRNLANEHKEYIDDHRFEPRALLKLSLELD
jgi:iron complex outermembrane receptor protein